MLSTSVTGSVAALWAALFANALAAAEPRSAAAAIVAAQETFARSGPGEQYYPSSILRRGDEVNVVGEAPDGWLAIAPPKGSFSWVPSDAVEELPDGTGKISRDGVRIRIGSELSDAHSVYQEQVVLDTGSPIVIADQAVLRDGERDANWYKILPAREEVRYVRESDLNLGVSKGPTSTAVHDPGRLPPAALVAASPRPIPINPIGPSVSYRVIPPAQPIRRQLGPVQYVTQRTTANKEAAAFQLLDDPELDFDRRLANLREQLGYMRNREPAAWNIPDALKILNDLKEKAGTPEQKAELQRTADQVGIWKRLQDRYAQSVALSEASRHRDAELESLQRRRENAVETKSMRFHAVGVLRQSAIKIDGQPTYTVAEGGGPASHYVLAAPGLNIAPYVGSRVGLIGSVTTRPSLPGPVITVKQLAPLSLGGEPLP